MRDGEIVSAATFYFDADCGFCAWAAEKLARIADVSVVGARSTNSNISAVVQHSIAVAAVFIEGNRVASGHRAIGEALYRYGNRAGWRCVGRVLLLPCPIWGFVYRLVARYRHRLAPLVGARACRI